MNYIPLHVHTCYTFLDSCLKIDDLVSIAKKNSFNAVGICDINGVYAFPKIYHSFKNNDIKPILGVTLSFKVDEDNFSFCLYVKNEIGYKNLCYILSQNSLSSKVLQDHKEGLILVIPCKTNNYIYKAFLNKQIENIHKSIFSLQKGFDEFYLGVELYQKEDKELMKYVREYAKKYTFKTIAFPLHLYETKHDAFTLDILNAIKFDRKLEVKDRKDGPYYFLSNTAINILYTKEEIQETHNLANSIDFEFVKKRGKIYQYSTNGIDKKKFILYKCKEVMSSKGIILNEKYQQRLNYELDMIEKMGYLDYFLIVSDYVNEAKKRNIPVGPGRGSAAGSLVSYCLGIIDIDPLKYSLHFERFLNPERVTLPDIDVDFADNRRNEVIDYIGKRFGVNKMSYIVTFQEIGAKQALQDIGRIFSFNRSDITTLSKACRGKDLTIKETIDQFPEFKSLSLDSYYSKIISLAELIEGYIRQPGMHPAGIILNDEPLENIIPLSRSEDGNYICQFEKDYLEEQGLLKMDILAVRNLSIIENIINKINSKGKHFNLQTIPLDDKKTFLSLNAGLTQGIFQLESEGITRALKEIKVSSFNDLVALLALYRPGPMEFIKIYAANKNNGAQIDYIDDSIKYILEPTFGVIIYQEQIMEIVQKVALFTLGEADILRRAISKKDEKEITTLKDKFIKGALKNKYSIEVANKIYDMIDRFANFGFNKAHTVSYALVTYQMAYLKTNYPCEFFASLLDYNSIGAKIGKYKNEFSLFDVSISLPDINRSDKYYQVSFNKLILPFSAIKGLTNEIINAIIFERSSNGNFKDFIDFICRMNQYKIKEDQIIALIDAGAFDNFEYNRLTLKNSIDTLVQFAKTTYNQISLFSQDELSSLMPIINKVEEDINQKYQNEMNVLGILLSGSLFSRYSNQIKSLGLKPLADCLNNKNMINLALIINDIKLVSTKKRENMAILTCIDDSSSINAVIFTDIYKKEKDKLIKNKPLLFTGYIRNDEINGLSFVVNSIRELEVNK